MRQWITYFVGTPQRFLATLVVIGVIFCLISPEIFANALNRSIATIINSLQPFVQPALTILIIGAAFKMFFPGGRKK